MTNIYRYVLDYDGGMAPHPKRGILSLATCKPVIRRCAQAGDWVVGCFPSPQNDRIAWAGVIAKCLPVGDYGIVYAYRDDALYPSGTRWQNRLPAYHPGAEQQRKDREGNALLFARGRSWYFGGDGRFLPNDLVHLAAHGQGHRINGVRPGDAERLEAWLRSEAPPGIHAAPRDGWYNTTGKSCAPAKCCVTPPSPRPVWPHRSPRC